MAGDTKIEIDPQLLRTLHRIHRQRTDLKSQIDRGPRQIKASETRIDQATAKVTEAKEETKKMKLVSDRKQLQLKEREDRIKDLERKLNTAASNREFSTLKEQIAADRQANEVLSDEILEVLEQLDGLAEQVAAAESDLQSQQQEHDQRIAEINERQVVVKEDLARVEEELVANEAKLPAAVRVDYQRIVNARGEEGLAPVDDESCSSCCQTLTTQFVERLQMSKLVRCPNCDAFLYFPEDRRVR